MENMKYDIGDKVRIKSLDWYNENKNEDGSVWLMATTHSEYNFMEPQSDFCGKVVTIEEVYRDFYTITDPETDFYWTDEMIEGLVEEEEIEFTEEDKYWCDIMSESDPTTYVLPEGYIFKDENGNEILTNKIILEKVNTLKIQSDNMETETHRGYCTTEPETTSRGKKVAWFTFLDNDFADKVELDLSNRELIQEDGKWFVVKKKSKYPKTYEECCEVLSIAPYYKLRYHTFEHGFHELATSKKLGLLQDNLNTLSKLLICRNAYWQLYGEEMELGKSWEPDWREKRYIIYRNQDDIIGGYREAGCVEHHIFEFPTKEMKDTFFENFKKDIEKCKEFL